MASRVLLRLNAAARCPLRVQTSSRSVHAPIWHNFGIHSRVAHGAQLGGMMSRAASTIPDDFDVDVEVPAAQAAAKTESVAPSPYLETLSLQDDPTGTDWSRSYHGLSASPFSKEITDTLLAPIEPMDIEIKPDGMIYLPEIKYRRILNKAFGPGGWGLAPRGETNVSSKVVSREYALVCLGRLVAIARGEQEFFDPSGVATATESCKSNALMRCCKDLGIASELWDPRFIREFKAQYCTEVFVEHATTKRKRKLWRRKEAKFDYPYKE